MILLERRNGRYLTLLRWARFWSKLRQTGWSQTHTVWNKKKCSPENLVLGTVWFMAKFEEITEKVC